MVRPSSSNDTSATPVSASATTASISNVSSWEYRVSGAGAVDTMTGSTLSAVRASVDDAVAERPITSVTRALNVAFAGVFSADGRMNVKLTAGHGSPTDARESCFVSDVAYVLLSLFSASSSSCTV